MSDILSAEVWRRKITPASHKNALLFMASQANDQGFFAISMEFFWWSLGCQKSNAYKIIRALQELEALRELTTSNSDEDLRFFCLNLDAYPDKSGEPRAVSSGTLASSAVRDSVSSGTPPIAEAVSSGTLEGPSPNDIDSNPLPTSGLDFTNQPLKALFAEYSGSYIPTIVHTASICGTMAVGQWEKGAEDKPTILFSAMNTTKKFDGVRALFAAIIEDIGRTKDKAKQIGKITELFMLVFGVERFDTAEVFKRIGKMVNQAGTPANLARRVLYFLIDQRGIIDDPYLALQHSLTKSNSKHVFEWWMNNENLVFLREGDRNKVIRMRDGVTEKHFIEHTSKDNRTLIYTHISQKSRVKQTGTSQGSNGTQQPNTTNRRKATTR
ncbi:MAG: hypothetical protein GY938_13060 [Ketobacter sp.]|nr:hypothetical protein [Ketobacter sp.]